MPNAKIPEWVKNRQTEIDKQQKKWQEQNAMFFKFPQGETQIFVDMQVPPVSKISKFGNIQWIYQVKVNGEIKKISVNVILDRAIIQALSEEINPMTIIRTGKEKDTRYSIKELED